jgi:hypothetical protein
MPDSKTEAKRVETQQSISALTGMTGIKGVPKVAKATLPPAMDSTINYASCIRYEAQSNNIVSVSVSDMIGALGGICTVTNSVFKPWTSSIRIRKVVCWPPAGAATAPSFAQVLWNSGVSGVNKDSELCFDVPAGITQTGSVTFTPPKRTLAADWMAASIGTTNIFTFSCSEGTIVDFHFEATLQNNFSPGTLSITTGTQSSAYYLPLDGASSHQYLPLHLPTTF